MSRCVTLECERYSCSRVSGRAVQSCQLSSITLAPLSTPYSRAAVQHWCGQRSDSCEQQQRCSIATSIVKQLTSPPAERLLLRVPVGRVPSCPRLSTVCPLSTSSTVVSSVLSLLFSLLFSMSSATSSASLSQGSTDNAVSVSVSQAQPLSPPSQSASGAPSASVGELQVEGWVKKYQTGDLLFDSARCSGSLVSMSIGT